MAGRVKAALAACALACGAAAAVASPAVAAESGAAQWTVTSVAAPTRFAPHSKPDSYVVTVVNTGSASGGPLTVEDLLPAGFKETSISGEGFYYHASSGGKAKPSCSTPTSPVNEQEWTCVVSEPVAPGDGVRIEIEGEVTVGAGQTLTNSVTAKGGGAEASATSEAAVSEEPASFGVQQSALAVGLSTLQAGAHPNVTMYFAINQSAYDAPAAQLRNVEFTLPHGLIGDPQATPTCTMAEVNSKKGCPTDAAVGTATITIKGGAGFPSVLLPVLVYNVTPNPGEPAAFGFNAIAPVRIDTSVLPDGEYAVKSTTSEIAEIEIIEGMSLTLWGVPAEHNGSTGVGLPGPFFSPSLGALRGYGAPGGGARVPLLTNPTQCETPMTADFAAEAWSGGGRDALAPVDLGTPNGCEKLAFSPKLNVLASTLQAGSPAGYAVHLNVPQNEEAEGLATAEARNVEVSMPPGTVISPSAANGLMDCSEAEFGLDNEKTGGCPPASQIGTASIATPLLAKPLEGKVYVGRPECEPCTAAQAQEGKMVRLLLEAQGGGVLVKLAGRTEINQTNGQLTTVFSEDPQLPFSELTLTLEAGPNAPLANPSTCGVVFATANLTPWSSLVPTALTSVEGLQISGCKAQAFSPSIEAGDGAGARGGSFSPLVVSLARPEGQQDLGTVSVQMPPGVEGMLSKVPLCPEAEANAGTCPAASEIGTTTTVVGPGSDPYTIEGGKVYLTERYGGGAFGLSIVTPAKAGPFTLAGETAEGKPGNGSVVIRASIKVNPQTAAITIGTGKLPTELDGIPLSIDRVIVNINRPEFMFNPTNCNAMSVTGTVTSASGTAASVSYPFQANNCAALPFKPTFSALTHAKHTRKNGDYLHVVVKSGPRQANIAKVHVELPEDLPSVLNTLKHACPEATFKANPASCPQGIVGRAIARTPVLPVPLSGPVYFVSHGAAKFPEIIAVLQGDGVTIDLAGDTRVEGKITTSTFNSVPDVPVSRFDMILPTGPKSAITGVGNLCKRSLIMPTEITGQNGAVIRKKTKVMVSGCKPTLYVTKHHVEGNKVVVIVQAPSGGRITANGKGLAKQTHRLRKAGRARISLPLKKAARMRLAHGHNVKVTVHLRFHPRGKGHGLKASVKVRLRPAHRHGAHHRGRHG